MCNTQETTRSIEIFLNNIHSTEEVDRMNNSAYKLVKVINTFILPFLYYVRELV